MPHTPSGGGSIAPPTASSRSTRMSRNAWRSRLSATARRTSGLSNGGAVLLTTRARLLLSMKMSETECGTCALTSCNSGIVAKIRRRRAVDHQIAAVVVHDDVADGMRHLRLDLLQQR